MEWEAWGQDDRRGAAPPDPGCCRRPLQTEDAPGVLDGAGDAGHATSLLDHGDEGLLLRCEAALVLDLDRDELGEAVAEISLGDDAGAQADEV